MVRDHQYVSLRDLNLPRLMGRVINENIITALLKNDSLNHFCLRFSLTLKPWHSRLRVPDVATSEKVKRQ